MISLGMVHMVCLQISFHSHSLIDAPIFILYCIHHLLIILIHQSSLILFFIIGQVYRVIDKQTNKVYALKKIIPGSHAPSEGLPATLIREIALFQAVDHPNVVKLTHIVSHQGDLCFCFEYLHTDLHSFLIAHQAPLSPNAIKVCFIVQYNLYISF